MSLPVVLRPEARDDLISARDWYERQVPGLGDELARSVDESLTRIESMPELYAPSFRGVRPAKLRRFPYVV